MKLDRVMKDEYDSKISSWKERQTQWLVNQRNTTYAISMLNKNIQSSHVLCCLGAVVFELFQKQLEEVYGDGNSDMTVDVGNYP